MHSFKTATLALILAFAPAAEANMTKEKINFIREMKRAERKGPIKISRPNLARYLQKAHVSNLKSGVATEASKKQAENQREYYEKFTSVQKFQSDLNRRAEEDVEGDDANAAYDNMQDWGTNNTNNHNYQQWLSDNWNMIKSMFRNKDNDEMYSNQNTTYDVYSLNDFSMKYAGCSSVGGLTDGSLTANNLIKYRLCPTESCQDNSWEGCNTEYGDYVMDLQAFLTIQSDVREEEVKLLCQYCESCYYFNSYFCSDVDTYEEDYNGGDNSCCVHTEECMTYNKLCENEEMGYDDEGDDDKYGQYHDVPDYDELFECKEVDLADFDYQSQYLAQQSANSGQENDDNQNNQNDYGYDGDGVGYLGVHCNGDDIEIGLFLDEDCTVLYQDDTDQQQLNFTQLAEEDFSSEDIEEFYIADTCVMCGGDDYNTKTQWWYIEEDRGEYDDEDTVNEMCTEMYEASAKCNINLDGTDDIFEESETEEANEDVTCTFVNRLMHNQVTSDGMVFAADDVDCSNLSNVQCLVAKMKKLSSATPAYEQGSNPVTGMQAFALTLGAIGSVGMAAAAFHLKQQIDVGAAKSLISNEMVAPGTPSQLRPLD